MTTTPTTPPPPDEIWVLCRMARSDIFYIRYNIEAYEGLGIPTTLPGNQGHVRIILERRQREEMEQVLAGMAEEIELEILEWGEGAP